MNKNQQMIITVAIITIAGMWLYPPCEGVHGSGVVVSLGYKPLPEIMESFGQYRIAALQLITQWVGVLILAGLAYLLTKTEK